MVFKPLGIAADGLGSLCGLEVFVFNDSLPGTLQGQWVAIHLNEAVDEVDHTLLLFYPGYAVAIENSQVARMVVFQQQVDDMTLLFVLGILLSLAEP